jgi:hypothetical protein
MGVYDNRELRNIFGPKKEDVKGTGEDTPQNVSIIRVIKYRIQRTEYVARLVQTRDANRVLVGKHEGKRRVGRTRRRWDDNINVHIKEK